MYASCICISCRICPTLSRHIRHVMYITSAMWRVSPVYHSTSHVTWKLNENRYGNSIGLFYRALLQKRPIPVTSAMWRVSPVYHSFHWKCIFSISVILRIPVILRIKKLTFLGISRYKIKLRFWFNLKLYREIWVSGSGGFRGCSISVASVISNMPFSMWWHVHIFYVPFYVHIDILYWHYILTYVQPIPLGVTFSKAQSWKLERLYDMYNCMTCIWDVLTYFYTYNSI